MIRTVALRAFLFAGLVSIPACSAKPASEAEREMKAGVDAFYNLHNPSAAIPHFQKVLALAPNHYGATYQLAKAFDSAGQPERAQPLWIKVFSMAEAAHDMETIAIVRSRLGQGSAAPSSRADTTMRAGLDAFYARHNPSEAADDFRKVLSEDPNHYGATFQLASALDQMGKHDEARPIWEKVLKMAQTDKDGPTAAKARDRLAHPR